MTSLKFKGADIAVPDHPDDDFATLLHMLADGLSASEIGAWIDRVADIDPVRAHALVIEVHALLARH